MKVQTIIDGLLNSELSNHAVASNDDPDKVLKLMLIWINQALRDINIRVPMIQKEKTYQLVTDSIDGGLTYSVPEDFMAILSAYDEKGKPLPVNDESLKTSIYTPNQNQIVIPYSQLGGMVTLIYQAKAPTLVAATDDLPVGDQFENVINYYIAMKALAPLETQGKPINVAYEQRYEKAIQQLINSGMYNKDSLQEVTHFTRGGWR